MHFLLFFFNLGVLSTQRRFRLASGGRRREKRSPGKKVGSIFFGGLSCGSFLMQDFVRVAWRRHVDSPERESGELGRGGVRCQGESGVYERIENRKHIFECKSFISSGPHEG